MGEEGDGVVDWSGAVHGFSRLWVVDASIIPGTLGVNPQHTIMALAMELSRRFS
jgi:choline dehydrogenase-like flavoprotein